jgi:hypothetical protein
MVGVWSSFHEHVGEKAKVEACHCLLQQFAQVRAIALVPEDAVTGIPPCGDMIKNAGMFETQWARHNVFLTLSAMSGKTISRIQRSDPSDSLMAVSLPSHAAKCTPVALFAVIDEFPWKGFASATVQ